MPAHWHFTLACFWTSDYGGNKMGCRKIILIDDNQALREAMALMLRLHHYEVTESHQLQHIFEQPQLPDLYIIDYWLNDLEGISVCSILKENVATREIPIIIMSGDPTVKTAVFSSGADAFLQKPFSMKKMLSVIDEGLNPSGLPHCRR